MASKKRRSPDPAAAVLLDRRRWKEWLAMQAELSELVHTGRDLVMQLRDLVGAKQRQKAAGEKAAATRRAALFAGKGTAPEAAK